MGSGIGFGGRGARPYRRRRPLPALIVIGVLCAGALGVWMYAIFSKADVDAAVRCEPPSAPPPGTTLTSLEHDALDGTSPIPPDKIAVRVLNAGGPRGQAALTTESLRALGFSETAEPGNDPVYGEKQEAKCRGQLRFGENGSSAARTLSLLEPCVELVKDGRQDATVDLVLGSSFGHVLPRQEAKQILDQLTTWSARNHGGGSEQSAGDSAPPLDEDLLKAAREGRC
ncbi:envelope integrity protein Cei [Amycolatopsis nigrescens]|uniref:envelope integrity protein Cei n=1 Tax=Amycolatopsis nigrescens TaxID=381445 RepID=UPI00035CCF74|nr:envelope integrity protein Cei [Amycolatopsis nigrescens]